MSVPTPGQTAGPFFGLSLPYGAGPELVPPGDPRAVRLHGRVLDGAGDPVPDALLELWQPDPSGAVVQQAGSLHRDGWTFTGWGRAATDAAGQWSFSTLAPGPVRPGAVPFFALTVFARGLLDRLWTRIYLPGSADALAADPLLAALPPERSRTLVAVVAPGGFAHDIVLQGPDETVFLDTRR
ncbi:MAG TPA: protocatechuate 3,4-dioxygenase subunit alpha [Mycobacteriales bacterium]